MYTSESQAAYRSASVDTETQIGLLLVSYEALAGYLGKAADAVDRSDIQARCEASTRALTLLGHIESWVNYLDDAALSASLSTFYTWLRQQIVLCQIAASRAQFDSLAEVVLGMRNTWQQKRDQLTLAASAMANAPQGRTAEEARSSSNWCA